MTAVDDDPISWIHMTAEERGRHENSHTDVDDEPDWLTEDRHASIAQQMTAVDSMPPGDTGSMIERLRSRLLTAAQVEALPPPSYLLDGIIVENSLGMIYGKWGAYKSVTALDWSASISTGAWWFGRRVRQGPVLYVAAEGLAGMGKRLRAWRIHRRIYDLPNLHFVRGAVPLLSLPDVIALRTVALEINPILIVVDTLSRSMAGGDENKPRDMSMLVDNITNLQEATGAAVWVVHHDTKAEGSSGRGHSSLPGAMDTIVEVKATEGRAQLTIEKQKDDAKAQPIRLHAVVVPLESGSDEEDNTSVVLDDRPDPNRGDDELQGKAAIVLEALERVAMKDGVSSTIWSESALGLSVSKSTFHEHKKTLIVRGLVRQIGEGRGARFAVAAREEDPDDDF